MAHQYEVNQVFLRVLACEKSTFISKTENKTESNRKTAHWQMLPRKIARNL